MYTLKTVRSNNLINTAGCGTYFSLPDTKYRFIFTNKVQNQVMITHIHLIYINYYNLHKFTHKKTVKSNNLLHTERCGTYFSVTGL